MIDADVRRIFILGRGANIARLVPDFNYPARRLFERTILLVPTDRESDKLLQYDPRVARWVDLQAYDMPRALEIVRARNIAPTTLGEASAWFLGLQLGTYADREAI